jgi:signal transduction histidine kinase
MAMGREVALKSEVPLDIGMVHVDGASLVQALANLVGNGIRFTPDGGEVRVQAVRDARWLVISVIDNGVGIEVDRQKELLGRSLSVRDSLNHHSSGTLEFNSAGLGLGFPIARGIVEAHGGYLTLDSAPGTGTTVTVRVPGGVQMRMGKAA